MIIRDVPRAILGESDCVQHALALDEIAGTRCAQPRASVLLPDSEAAAAEDVGSPRVHLLDFTPFFCDDSRCFPAVGGALVLKDLEHMTRAYSATLGPYLLRSLNRLN